MPLLLKPSLLKFYYGSLKYFYTTIYLSTIIWYFFRHWTNTDFYNCLTLDLKKKKKNVKDINLNCQGVTEKK